MCPLPSDSWFNLFPHDKILDQTKLKAFADDKLNVIKMIISVFDRVENIVAKGEIACTSNFYFSHNVFKRLLFQTRPKVSLCGNGLTKYRFLNVFAWNLLIEPGEILKITAAVLYVVRRKAAVLVWNCNYACIFMLMLHLPIAKFYGWRRIENKCISVAFVEAMPL